MSMTVNERRQVENEMIFRRANEKVGDDLDSLDTMHMEDGNPGLVRSEDTVLHFRCECSDEDCDARIPIKRSIYTSIHENRKAFVIKPKHQVEAIEKVIATEDAYSIVEKNNSISEPGNTLNTTSINNS